MGTFLRHSVVHVVGMGEAETHCISLTARHRRRATLLLSAQTAYAQTIGEVKITLGRLIVVEQPT